MAPRRRSAHDLARHGARRARAASAPLRVRSLGTGRGADYDRRPSVSKSIGETTTPGHPRVGSAEELAQSARTYEGSPTTDPLADRPETATVGSSRSRTAGVGLPCRERLRRPAHRLSSRASRLRCRRTRERTCAASASSRGAPAPAFTVSPDPVRTRAQAATPCSVPPACGGETRTRSRVWVACAIGAHADHVKAWLTRTRRGLRPETTCEQRDAADGRLVIGQGDAIRICATRSPRAAPAATLGLRRQGEEQQRSARIEVSLKLSARRSGATATVAKTQPHTA